MTIETNTFSLETVPEHPGRTPDVRVISGAGVLRPGNDALFNDVLDYVEDTAGTPINPYALVDSLREKGFKLPQDDIAAGKIEKLVGKWSDEMLEYLEERGLGGGKWMTMPDGKYVFAPDTFDLKIRDVLREQQHDQKPGRVPTAHEIRDAVWREPIATPREGLMPESELTHNQKEILNFLSRLSVRQSVEYPTENEIAERIARASKGYAPKAIHQIIGGLVKEEFLFPYRKGGEDYVTTNANIAYETNRAQKARRGKKELLREEETADPKIANELVAALLAAPTGNDTGKYTIQKIWTMMQEQKGVVIHRETPSKDEERIIRKAATALASEGLLSAGMTKSQTAWKGANKQTFKLGFAPKQRAELAKMTPGERDRYVADCIARQNTR